LDADVEGGVHEGVQPAAPVALTLAHGPHGSVRLAGDEPLEQHEVPLARVLGQQLQTVLLVADGVHAAAGRLVLPEAVGGRENGTLKAWVVHPVPAKALTGNDAGAVDGGVGEGGAAGTVGQDGLEHAALAGAIAAAELDDYHD